MLAWCVCTVWTNSHDVSNVQMTQMQIRFDQQVREKDQELQDKQRELDQCQAELRDCKKTVCIHFVLVVCSSSLMDNFFLPNSQIHDLEEKLAQEV